MRTVEPYLGDCRDMPPLIPVRRVAYRHPRWIEDGTAAVLAIVGVTVFSLLIALAVWMLFTLGATRSLARDLDGRYAQSPHKTWFDQLRSRKGLCCSLADGLTIKDVDWSTDGAHYRVRIEGRWLDVPDDALVTEPNRVGVPMVWPVTRNGVTTINCFMPGALT